MSEDKMREEFYKAFPKFAGILEMDEAGSISHLDSMTARHQFAVWKACAAIKDAEIAARDLMIKELREVLISVSEYTRHPDYDWDSGLIKDVEQALANSEHIDGKALEKALLEAEIKALNAAYHICNPYGEEFRFMITQREAKLAELNKE